MAAGGLGTVGTLIYMILDSKRKAKQIDTVQKIQSHQLESLYEPDIRITSWTFRSEESVSKEMVIKNHGEDLKLLDIIELSDSHICNHEGMKGWFPYDFDKDTDIHIPLSAQMKTLIGTHSIGIVCSNRLGLEYLVPIVIVDGKPRSQRPKIR